MKKMVGYSKTEPIYFYFSSGYLVAIQIVSILIYTCSIIIITFDIRDRLLLEGNRYCNSATKMNIYNPKDTTGLWQVFGGSGGLEWANGSMARILYTTAQISLHFKPQFDKMIIPILSKFECHFCSFLPILLLLVACDSSCLLP